MSMTSTQIRCMLAILSLTGMQEEVASKNIAKLLGVSRPSVHKTLDILCREGMIEKEPYGSVNFTSKGLAAAQAMEAHREGLFLLFSQIFGLAPDESSAAAILLMGELRQESLGQLLDRARELARICPPPQDKCV